MGYSNPDPFDPIEVVENMSKTIAEVLIEQGREEGRPEGALSKAREILLRQLQKKFKRVPPTIRATINATTETKKLDEWLDRVVIAEKLADFSFSGRS